MVRMAGQRGWLSAAQVEEILRLPTDGASPGDLERLLAQRGGLRPEQIEVLKAAARDASAAETIRPAQAGGDGAGTRGEAVEGAGVPAGGREMPGEEPTILESAVGGANSAGRRSDASGADPTARLPEGVGADRTVGDSARASTGIARPPRRFGPYEVVGMLGRGGMGVVYQARHLALGTHVAVKVLLAADLAGSEEVARFRREAQTCARLRHPGIVRVHDIGESAGATWLAMEFVDGETLDRVLRRRGEETGDTAGLPWREALAIVAEMADALQYAHEQGILHRDIKPANVMRDRAGRIRVMDFGLAKVVEAEGSLATRTGALLGTPVYMSPEQAGGGRAGVDARSDVYQLGATLYHLLTGRRPYDGPSAMEVILQVTREGPPPPRRWVKTIDRGAETICLKAMAREPEGRYPTAGALADDCRRWLAGQPILARGEPWWRPLRRRLVRARAAVALVALILTGVGVTAAMSWRARALDREVLEGMRGIARTHLEAALLVRRTGGALAAAEVQFLPPLVEAARRVRERAPGLAEPHYHVGRLQRALLRYDQALAEQEEALRREPGFVGSLYERSVLRIARYEDRMRELRIQNARWSLVGIENVGTTADLDAAESDPEAQALREEIRADLARLRAAIRDAERPGAGTDGPASELPPGPTSTVPGGLSAAHELCAEGLFLAYAGGPGDAPRAGELLRAAIASEPTLEEAYQGLGMLAEARKDWEGALAWYERGRRIDAGHQPFWMRSGDCALQMGSLALIRGEDAAPWFERALENYERLFVLGGPKAACLLRRSHALTCLGSLRSNRGPAADALMARAAADLDQILSEDSASPDWYIARAALRLEMSAHGTLNGGEADAELSQAEADLEAAARLDPTRLDAPSLRGYITLQRAYWVHTAGGDAGDLYERAIRDLRRIVAENPQYPSARTFLASALYFRGNYLSDREHPGAAESYGEAAIEHAERARRAPDAVDPFIGIGQAHGALARLAAKRGGDPRPHLDTAEAAYQEAITRSADRAEAWMGLARTRANRVLIAPETVPDPVRMLEEIATQYGEVLRLHPGSRDARSGRSDTLRALATTLVGLKRDPTTALKRAIEDLDAFLAISPEMPEAWAARGEAWERIGDAATGRDAEAAYRKAVADYSEAARIRPGSTLAHGGVGTASLGLARILAALGEDSEAVLAASEAAFGRAMGIEPEVPEHVWWRGIARDARARARSVAGREAAVEFGAACEDLGRALALRPGWMDALRSRGIVHSNWAGHEIARGRDALPLLDRAHADLTRALEIVPGNATLWLSRGVVELDRGSVRRGRGEDPSAAYAAAAEDFDRAAAADPSLADAWAGRARARCDHAVWSVRRGRDPGSAWDEARADLDRAASLSARPHIARMIRGVLAMEYGRHLFRNGGDPSREWAAARVDLDAAIAGEPVWAQAWIERGRLGREEARLARARGADPGPALARARADLEEAYRLCPGVALSAWLLARVHRDLGATEAEAAWQERARAVHPNADAVFPEFLD